MSENGVTYISTPIPEHGTATEVADGVFWFRMPLPFKLDHINLWLLDDGEGWTVVDTGFCNDTVKAHWETLFATFLKGKPIKRMIVTHFHPDHMGLAGWLQERFDCPLWASQGEWAMGRMLSLDTGESSLNHFKKFYHGAGFDDALLAVVERRLNPYRKRVSPIPGGYRRLRNGDTVSIGGRDWSVMVGTGHSPEHCCLFCADLSLLISGDQVLPRISPNVSVWPQEPEANPLDLFLKSLPTFKPLPEDTLTLPSHDRPFTGLHGRLDDLAHHHDARLEETFQACATPASGMDILRHLFTRELDEHQVFFAIGESLAHLHYLEGLGRLVRHIDENGVHRFSQV